MNTTQKRVSALAIAALTAIGAFTAAPAQAADFSVSATKTTNLVASGDTTIVTLGGVPEGAGVYVRLCAGSLADVSKARPASCFGQGAWVSLAASSLGMGAKTAAAPVVLAVQSKFKSGATEIDCSVQACGIHIRRDHLAGTDFSLDRFIPVTFASTAASANAVYAGGKVQITVANLKGTKATFTVAGKKYVRNITNDNFVFAVKATAGKSVNVGVAVSRKAVLNTKLKLS
jgi:hypothetical protein